MREIKWVVGDRVDVAMSAYGLVVKRVIAGGFMLSARVSDPEERVRVTGRPASSQIRFVREQSFPVSLGNPVLCRRPITDGTSVVIPLAPQAPCAII